MVYFRCDCAKIGVGIKIVKYLSVLVVGIFGGGVYSLHIGSVFMFVNSW